MKISMPSLIEDLDEVYKVTVFNSLWYLNEIKENSRTDSSLSETSLEQNSVILSILDLDLFPLFIYYFKMLRFTVVGEWGWTVAPVWFTMVGSSVMNLQNVAI